MSAKHLRAIAIGVALLLILWGATEMWARRTKVAATEHLTLTEHLALPAIAVGDVDTVVITHETDTVLLVQESPGTWTVNRHRASQTSIDDFFQAFRDSVKPTLVAESPASFARMGVDSAAGLLVRMTGGGKTLAQVLVGDLGPGGDAAFVRIPGEARVYLLPGRLPALARRRADDWRDRQIGAVAPESIAVVEIHRGAKRTTLRKREGTWVLSGGAPADSGEVARLLERFRSVSAAGFATDRQADSIPFARPQRRVSVAGTDARNLLALVFDSTAGGFWARKAGDRAVYRLDFWQVDQLTPAEDAFKPRP